MGRGKVQLKRIENKSSRQITFSKRKNGLIKKAGALAVLCDVDLALIIFSPTGKLFHYPTEQSLKKIVDRYVDHVEEEAAVCNIVKEATQNHDESMDIWKGTSLLEMVNRHTEDQNIEHLDMTRLIQLEKQLDCMLGETRKRKKQVLMDAVAAWRDKEKELRQENHDMKKKIAARMDLVEDDEGVNHDPRSNSCEPPPQKCLLQLF